MNIFDLIKCYYFLKTNCLNCSAEACVRQSLSPFQNAYLSRSVSRLFDPINLMFSERNDRVPLTDECDGLMKVIQR